MGDAGDF
jgi:hypothetical protein